MLEIFKISLNLLMPKNSKHCERAFLKRQPTNGFVKAIYTYMTSTQTLLEDLNLNPCFHSLFHFSLTLDTDPK